MLLQRFVIFIFLFFISNTFRAQSQTHYFVSMQMQSSVSSFSQIKIGLPSFSMRSGIEKKFTITPNFHFTTQYALNYFAFQNSQLQHTLNKYPAMQQQVQLTAVKPIRKKSVAYAGLGIEHSVFIQQKYSNSNKSIQSTKETNNHFSANDFKKINPYFLMGIENSLSLLNIQLYYTLQYNIGFQKHATYQHNSNGFSVGLKYKY